MATTPLPISVAASDRPGRRLVVGIGEFAVSDDPHDVIVTHALGSCIAVCVWDPQAHVVGLLHFLLPEAKVNPERAREQPAAFADTGLPIFFQAAYRAGLDKKRCRVRLVGGAETRGGASDNFNIGKRNLLAARSLLWRNGLMIHGEATGGTDPRTVSVANGTGRVDVSTGGRVVELP